MVVALESRLDAAIARATDFLFESQQQSGEFNCYSSSDPAMASDCNLDSSPFPTALIAYCLGFADNAQAKHMRSAAARFLLSQMERCGVWRYWTAKHPYHRLIPPDLDDTVCSSIILAQNNVPYPDNRELVLSNRSKLGLFYTWVVPRLALRAKASYWRVVTRLNPFHLLLFFRLHQSARPNDIDGVVNANALFYLGESEESRRVSDYLIEIVMMRREAQCDKWHLSSMNFYYSLSRNYYAGMHAFECVRELVIERIHGLVRANHSVGSHVLDTALAACSLLNWHCLSPQLKQAIDYLLAEQRPSGSWPRIAMYHGGPDCNGPDKYYGWGSEELTTAFCLEALLRYRDSRTTSNAV